MTSTPAAPSPRPMHPLAVLALAIVLPGSGQVFNREPFRGLIFLFFINPGSVYNNAAKLENTILN